ncbi:unnamed protein product [Rotaria sp. Silwood2]|nr:unnamed protein product [Rotaria sp. Silwood2]
MFAIYIYIYICTIVVVVFSLLIYTFSGGSSNTLINTDSRDVSPSSVFGGTRNTSPVGNNGYLTPRRGYSPNPAATAGGRIPIRKNSFVVTESQYTDVLPSVSPRSTSPAIRTGQWSGRVTPSALETCMETSFILSDSPLQCSLLPNNADNTFVNSAPGRLSHTNVYITSF